MLVFNEPHETGGDCTIRISEEKAIEWQKNYAKSKKPDFAYKNDEEALEDFMTINYAWKEVPIESEIFSKETTSRLIELNANSKNDCTAAKWLGIIEQKIHDAYCECKEAFKKEKNKHDCTIGGHKFKPYHTITITGKGKDKTLLMWKCKYCKEERKGRLKDGLWEVDWLKKRFVEKS